MLEKDKKGTLYVKIKDKWIPKHYYMWELYHHRRLEKDESVIFLDKDKHNFAYNNLALVNTHEKMMLLGKQQITTDSDMTLAALNVVRIKDVLAKKQGKIEENAVKKTNGKRRGTLYYDRSTKGTCHGRHTRFNCWCAEIFIDKKRYRRRSKNLSSCINFLNDLILMKGLNSPLWQVDDVW